MGAEANAQQTICSKTAALLTVDTEMMQAEDSTLPLAKAIDLVNKCSTLVTHEEELKAFKEVGSKTPILTPEVGTDPDYKFTIVWFNFIGFIILHIIGFSGVAAAVFGYCSVWTSLYCEFYFYIFLYF